MRTLNLAIPITFLLGYTLGMVVYSIAAHALINSGVLQRTAEVIGGWFALVVTVAIALYVARRKIKALGKSTNKTENGHALLAFANTAALLSIAFPAAASLIGNPDNAHYMWFAVPVMFVNFFLWPIGWVRATSS